MVSAINLGLFSRLKGLFQFLSQPPPTKPLRDVRDILRGRGNCLLDLDRILNLTQLRCWTSIYWLLFADWYIDMMVILPPGFFFDSVHSFMRLEGIGRPPEFRRTFLNVKTTPRRSDQLQSCHHFFLRPLSAGRSYFFSSHSFIPTVSIPAFPQEILHQPPELNQPTLIQYPSNKG